MQILRRLGVQPQLGPGAGQPAGKWLEGCRHRIQHLDLAQLDRGVQSGCLQVRQPLCLGHVEGRQTQHPDPAQVGPTGAFQELGEHGGFLGHHHAPVLLECGQGS